MRKSGVTNVGDVPDIGSGSEDEGEGVGGYE